VYTGFALSTATFINVLTTNHNQGVNAMRQPFKTFNVILLAAVLAPTTTVYAKSDSEKAGDILHIAIPVAGLGMALAKHDQEGVYQLGKTMATNLAATYALKYATNDTAWGERPNGEDYSFPSGHASNSCAGATFIGQRYGWRYGSMAMIPAAYVGWSRVDADKHYTRDVIAGCALGVVSGLVMTQPFDNATILPWYENKAVGVTISSAW